MHTRTLGRGPKVSAIGLDGMTTTGGYSQHPDRGDMIAMIRSAVELGVTCFDIAEISGPHTNEELVGEALGPIREQVVNATKFAQDIDPVERKARGCMLLPHEVAAVVEGSLKRDLAGADDTSERAGELLNGRFGVAAAADVVLAAVDVAALTAASDAIEIAGGR